MKTEFIECKVCGFRMQKEKRRKEFCTPCARTNKAFNLFLHKYDVLNWKGKTYYSSKMSMLVMHVYFKNEFPTFAAMLEKLNKAEPPSI